MTTDQVAAWMRAHGVDESIIRDEANYIATAYADPDENPLAVLEASLPGYLQRSASGRDYSTDEGDPEVQTTTSMGTFTAPYRPPGQDIPPPVIVPAGWTIRPPTPAPTLPPVSMTAPVPFDPGLPPVGPLAAGVGGMSPIVLLGLAAAAWYAFQ